MEIRTGNPTDELAITSYDNSLLAAKSHPAQPESKINPEICDSSCYPAIPSYLRDVYAWAYLDPANVRLLDHDLVVAAILLGNSGRLGRALMTEISAGQKVLQVAHVYGSLIPNIARKVGVNGMLDVVDLVPLQAAICQQKLCDFPQAKVTVADASDPGASIYDVVSCFFLLHEIPDDKKRAVVDASLARIKPGGKVVFIDYHGPDRWHPLRAIMHHLLNRLEPFALSLWRHEIKEFASSAESYRWQKSTFFGGLYQKVTAYHR